MVLFGDFANQPFVEMEKTMNKQPKLLCLKGSIKPGECVARFDFEQGCFSAGVYQVKIEFLTFCDDQNHNAHFAEPRRISYPIPHGAPDGYQPEIRVRVPRPIPLVHRRRTVYVMPYNPPSRTPSPEIFAPLAEYLDPPAAGGGVAGVGGGNQPVIAPGVGGGVAANLAPFVHDENHALRFKRSIDSENDNNGENSKKRIKRAPISLPLNAYDFDVSCSFNKRLVKVSENFSFRDQTLAAVKDKFNQALIKIYKMFGNIIDVNYRVGVTIKREDIKIGNRPESRDQLVITLPPLCSLGFEHEELLVLLGFAGMYSREKMYNENKYSFVLANRNSTEVLEFKSNETYKSTSKMITNVTDWGSRYPENKAGIARLHELVKNLENITFSFDLTNHGILMRYRPQEYTRLSAILNSGVVTANSTQKFFKIVLQEISSCMMFPNQFFKFTTRLDRISIKIPTATFEKQSASLSLTFRFGAELAKILGLTKDQHQHLYKLGVTENEIILHNMTAMTYTDEAILAFQNFEKNFDLFLNEFKSGKSVISTNVRFLNRFKNDEDYYNTKVDECRQYLAKEAELIEQMKQQEETETEDDVIVEDDQPVVGVDRGVGEEGGDEGEDAQPVPGIVEDVGGVGDGGGVQPAPGNVGDDGGGVGDGGGVQLAPGNVGDGGVQPAPGNVGDDGGGVGDGGGVQPAPGNVGDGGGAAGGVVQPPPVQPAPVQPPPVQPAPVQPQPVQPAPVQPQPVQPPPVQPAPGNVGDGGGAAGGVVQPPPVQPAPVQPPPVQPAPVQPAVVPVVVPVQPAVAPVQPDVDVARRNLAEAIENDPDPFDEINIPNPEPRPSNTFLYRTSSPITVCGDVDPGFPITAYVIVKEAEPVDWIFERGPLAIAGILTKEPNTSYRTLKHQNTMFLKNYNFVTSLTLEFMTPNFIIYQHPANGQTGLMSMLLSVRKLS